VTGVGFIVAAQLVPHAPQLFGSFDRSKQVDAQQVG
jgi:hypothetical protein